MTGVRPVRSRARNRARTTTRRRWRGQVLASLALVGGLLAACGGSSSGSGQTITLYNGQHVQTTDSLVAGFEKATGINVNVRSDDEDTLADEIVTEGARSPADVIYTENTPAIQYLADKNLLATVDASTLAHTPSQYNSTDGSWVGVSARVSVLIYNPSLITKAQLPTSVVQLADPRYQGQLAFAAGETDFQPIVTSMDRKYEARRRSSGSTGSRPMPAVTSTPTMRPSPMKSTGAPSPSAWSTSTTGIACKPRSVRQTSTRTLPTSLLTMSVT